MAQPQFKLTAAQEAVYFDQLLHGENPLYNVGGYLVLHGYEAEAIMRAHRRLVAREPVFRTRIVQTGQGPQQTFRTEPPPDPTIEDCTAEGVDPEARAKRRIDALFARPLDLGGDLFRVLLLRTGPERYLYVGLAHHVVVDGWGFFNWARKLYEILRNETGTDAGGDAGAETPGEDNEDYTAVLTGLLAEERAYATSARRETDARYWHGKFTGPSADALTSRRPASATGTPTRRLVLEVPAETQSRIDACARALRVAPASLHLALFATHFLRYFDSDRLDIGVPYHGRNDAAQRRLIGQQVKILPLHLARDATTTLSGLIAAADLELRTVYRHRRLPIAEIRGIAQHHGRAGRLFDLCFNYIDTRRGLGPIGGALFGVGNGHEPTPLTLTVFESAGGFRVEFDYRTDYFTQAETERIGARYLRLMSRLGANPGEDLDARIDALDLLPEEERARLLAEAPVPPEIAAPEPVTVAIARRFVECAERTAIVCRGRHHTYRELEARVNVLQSALAARGIGRGGRVGLALARGFDLIATMLAVLRLGACYIPLDPKYPGERCRRIAADAGADLILVDTLSQGEVFGGEVLVLALSALTTTPAPPALAIEPDGDALFYLVYTSGSTGTPKGVRIRHRNVAGLIAWARATYRDDELAGVLAATSINFDLSVFEIFVPLCSGTRMFLVDDVLSVVADPPPVSLINTVPSAIAGLLDAGAVGTSVRTVNLAGEQLTAPLVRRLFAETGVRRVFNLYGPSEDTTYSTGECFESPVDSQPPIGAPLPGKRVRLLSRSGALAPHGAVGEIHIGGCGLADGYQNNEALTRRAFVADPCSDDPCSDDPCSDAPERLVYRTGDLARYTDDLRLIFLGRIDDQVKVRGFRIEPEEVETVMREVLGFGEIVVLATGDAESRRLVAYFQADTLEAVLAATPAAVATTTTDPAAAIRERLRPWLPAYMIPEICIALPRFPRTPNGKIDRHAFPADPRPAAPRTTDHEDVARIVAELLGLETVDPAATFFGLGGNSLQALTLRNTLKRALGIELGMAEFLANPTIAELAGKAASTLARMRDADTGATDHAQAHGDEAPVAVPRMHDHPASAAQAGLWTLETVSDAGSRYHMPAEIDIDGPFSVAAFTEAIARIAHRHEALRTRFFLRENRLRQQPLDEMTAPVRFTDLSEHAPSARDTALDAMRRAAAGQRFDLARGEVFRVEIARLSARAHRVFLCFHHIAFDGLSAGVFHRELSRIYAAALVGRDDDPPPPAMQYIDYAAWRERSGPASQAADAFWEEYLHGAPASHDLPMRHRPALNRALIACEIEAGLNLEASERIAAQCRRHGLSLFHFLQSAFAFLVCRSTASEEAMIGSPVSGREHPDFEATIGMLVNPVAFRYRRRQTEDFAAFLDGNRVSVTNALAHQGTPFARVVERIGGRRDGRIHPLFQLWFVYDDFGRPPLALGDAAVAVTESATLVDAKFDLNLYATLTEGALSLRWVWAEGTFETDFIAGLSRAYLDIIGAVADTAAGDGQAATVPIPIPIPIPAPSEPAMDIGEALETVFRDHAEMPALRHGDALWTYARLGAAADAVAARFERIEGARILLLLDHDPIAAAAILGAVRAGIAYVPVDPELPETRIERILADSGARAIACGDAHRGLAERLATRIPGIAIMVLGPDATEATAPATRPARRRTDEAYVLYTSGSTGAPKGIAQSRERAHFFTRAYARELALAPGERVLMTARFTVDAGVMDLYGALLAGATLHLCDLRNEPDPLRLARKAQVSLFHFTATVFKALFARAADASFRGRVVIGGEGIDVDTWALFRRVFDAESELIGLYGATEASFTFLQRHVAENTRRRLGRPVPGLAAQLLRADGTAAGMAEEAELAISGAAIAPCYLDAAENRRRYDGDAATGYRYRTGDLCRLTADGGIEYLRRRDSQVKIMGQRVEPGEIDALLRASGLCEDAATLVGREADRPVLHCFAATGAAGATSGADARRNAILELLRSGLPYYMVPHRITLLAALPRTISGKVDRQKLLTLAAEENDRTVAKLAPRTALERELLTIWRELLGTAEIGVNDEFFAVGGDSLSLIQLIGRIGSRYAVALPPKYFYGSLTIERLAAVLECVAEYRAPERDETALARIEI